MNYNQNYEYEEEIDLIKLILFVLSKWRSIIACVLVGAILGGALAMVKAPDISVENADAIPEENTTYQQNISIISSDEEVFDSFIDAFYHSGALYEAVMEDENVAEDFDITSKITLHYDSSSKKYNTNLFNIFGFSEKEVQHYADKTLAAIEKYIALLHDDLRYAVVESEIFAVEELAVAVTAEPNETEDIVLYAIIGAFIGGVISAGVWFVVFFAGGKLYAVSDIERKFRTKVLGSVTVCEKKNPIDRWIFHKMNGLYSEFSKEEQEKIVLLNIKNELKKNENIKKVMLVSSFGEAINDSAAFIKTGLEEAGYMVSGCVNVIGRPDVFNNSRNFDSALIVENTNCSKSILVDQEIKTLKDYLNIISGITILN